MIAEPSPSDWIDEALAALDDRQRRRQLVTVIPRSATTAQVCGQEVILFSANDYLGLSFHPAVRRAVADTAEACGLGSRASALVCGYSDLHAQLEESLAGLKQTEAALLLPTGYAANLAALSSVGGEDTEIFSDALNHASIIDGCRLADCRVQIYRHNDADHLEGLVKSSRARHKVIVTDSVFSMEGDWAPLADLVQVKERHGCLLVIDEAHATLVHGDRGGGVAEALGVSERVDLQIGTLSKAFGLLGGFIATSRKMRELLINRARSLIFSTALPAPIVAGALAALAVSRDGSLRRALVARVGQLGQALRCQLRGPIAPLVLGAERRASEASRALLARDLLVPAIRPPSVPPGTSRLRITLSAAHTGEQVQALVTALEELGICST